MTTFWELKNDYFDWLCDIVCGDRFGPHISYRRLLKRLYVFRFWHSIRNDRNRAENGKSLRYRFLMSNGIEPDEIRCITDEACSVLEMMVALSIKCEEEIMDNPAMGDRTSQWFWGMIKSLGLINMSDDNYDEEKVDFIIQRFLNREYEPNGKGGLFTIKNCDVDLRDYEIWFQLCHYLDTIA